MIVKKYIDEMLRKKFIKKSISHYAASMLIIKKSKKNFKICVDYKTLNALTVKNRNASSLIKKILTRLNSIKIYNKFDIVVVFNEVRIKKNDEHKTIFLTRYDFFEYVMMSFELCNASKTFQTFINFTLKKYLNDFCTNYLNDIFIYSDNKKKHIAHVFKMLERLQHAELFLNVNKCEFFVTTIKYLKLIITIEKVKMNSIKVKAIVNWKSLKNLKDVQTFIDFVNFYKKFILSYFRIILFLIKLTKFSKKNFAFSWSFDESKKTIFKKLKLTFTTTFILTHFDIDVETWIEIDASNYVITTIIFQRKIDENLHFVTYMSKKMSSIECNYEIYDKKLLIIIKVFEKWRLECAKTLVDSSIKILIDHKNLKYFMTSKQLNRRQVKWIEFLIEFNFKIAYKSNTQNTKSNNLTRRSENLSKNRENERHKYNHKVLLKEQCLNAEIRKTVKMTSKFMNENEKIVTALTIMLYELNAKNEKFESNNDDVTSNEKTTSTNEKSKNFENEKVFESSVVERIKNAYSNDVIFQRIMKNKRNEKKKISIDITKSKIKLEFENCEIIKNFFYVRKRLYVFNDETFHASILKFFHDNSSTKHANKFIIYDRISRHYFWSKMTETIVKYVKNCHICKRIKHYRKSKQKLFKSLSIFERYFQNISIDFIISLFKCMRNDKTYKHIMIIMNRFNKKKKFVTLYSLNVETMIQIFIEWIWREEKYFSIIVSNKKTQFIVHFWRRLCKRIDTNSKLFIAWHSKTDDQTKIINANLKTYFRAFVNYNQNNWVNYLTIIEFEINSTKSSLTNVESFLTTKKYFSRLNLESSKSIIDTTTQKKNMKNVDKLIEKLKIIKVFLRNELKWAQTQQKHQANRRKQSTTKFRVDDKIMLNFKFLKTLKSNNELNYKNLNSFTINRMINNNAYQLNLSKSMSDVFSIFHSWLLHLNNSNFMSKQKNDESNSIVRNVNENEYSMNEILNFKIDRRKNDSATSQRSCLQYQIKWTNYVNVNIKFEWYDYTKIANVVDLIIDFHHKYFEKLESHASFVKSQNWKFLK